MKNSVNVNEDCGGTAKGSAGNSRLPEDLLNHSARSSSGSAGSSSGSAGLSSGSAGSSDGSKDMCRRSENLFYG